MKLNLNKNLLIPFQNLLLEPKKRTFVLFKEHFVLSFSDLRSGSN